MQFAFTEEQQLIRDSAREWLDANASSAQVRQAVVAPLGFDASLWNTLARELGWTAIAIPRDYGGSGLGLVELAILQYEQGRRLAPSPFFATVCLGAPVVLTLGREEQKQELLGRVARGDLRLALGMTGESGAPGPDGITAVLRRGRPGSDREYRLSGTVEFVVHGSACDRLLVAARAPGSVGGQGISVVLVDPHAQGVGIYDPVTIDVTRRMSRITFHDVPVSEQCVLGEAEAAGEGLERALQYARIALAAEAVGAAEWTLEMTTAYARQRVQFGRPIGSFQVIKHRLADMMIRIEAAQSAAWYAACVADELEAELDEAAAIAKACCCDAFYRCAADAIQLHGGIGFTWEHDAHLYFKRARATATLLGSPAWHRERLAQLMGLGRTCTVPTY